MPYLQNDLSNCSKYASFLAVTSSLEPYLSESGTLLFLIDYMQSLYSLPTQLSHEQKIHYLLISLRVSYFTQLHFTIGQNHLVNFLEQLPNQNVISICMAGFKINQPPIAQMKQIILARYCFVSAVFFHIKMQYFFNTTN